MENEIVYAAFPLVPFAIGAGGARDAHPTGSPRIGARRMSSQLMRALARRVYRGPNHFGRCPECKGDPRHMPIATAPGSWKLVNVMGCQNCKIAWVVGVGLLSWPGPEPPPDTPEAAGLAGFRGIPAEDAYGGPVGWARFMWPVISHVSRVRRWYPRLVCRLYMRQVKKADIPF